MNSIFNLLGCDWGTRVALPGDQAQCANRAVQRVMLHGHPTDGEFMVQLCHKHLAVVTAETDPHKAVTL